MTKKTPRESAEQPTFEDALDKLEGIVERLEEGEVPLEESLTAYEEGTRLVRFCLETLEKAEGRIRTLSETAEGFRLDPSALGSRERNEDAAPDAD